MEFKGTKGEWHTVEVNRVVYVENKDQVLISELDNKKTLGFNQATPTAVYFNAKLISAAPELLEALKSMVNIFDRELPEGSIGSKTCNKAKEAIKKATT